jgi:D-amino-acid dehydrogenase
MSNQTGGRRAGDTVVIGAGIIGICCACHLQRAGFSVRVIDRLPPGEGTSFGNAGGLATGEIIPHATPGLIRDLPRWLLDPLGPLAVRWSYLPKATPWLLRFLRAGAAPRVRQIATALAALSKVSQADYQPLLAESGLSDIVARHDCLYVYTNERQIEAERLKWDLRREHGISFERLEGPALRELEPDLAPDLKFGYRLHGWYHVINPFRLVASLAEHFVRQGGEIERGDVVKVELAEGCAKRLLLSDSRALDVERLVIAAGAWSHTLARQLGSRVPLESHRGYHVTIPDAPINPKRLVLYSPLAVVAVPMEMGIRVAGTVEIAGLTAPPNYERARALVRGAKRIYPALDNLTGTEWMGHRPAMPDSLPVIGRSPVVKNVYYAFGHGHLGLTFGATTGRLVAELASGKPPSLDLQPYRVDRF